MRSGQSVVDMAHVGRSPVIVLVLIYLNLSIAMAVVTQDDRSGLSADWILMEQSQTTLGGLVQASEAIARVKVIAHKEIAGTEDMIFTLAVHDVLYGSPPREVRRSLTYLIHAPELPEIGEEGIMFMARRQAIRPVRDEIVDVFVLKADEAAYTSPLWRIEGGSRGFIRGDNATLREVVSAIQGFIRWHRTKDTTTLEHAQFLATLLTSDQVRLRVDGLHASIALRNSLSTEQRAELMTMDGFPEVIRKTWMDWDARVAASIEAGRLAIIEAEKAKIIRTREDVEADFEQANWREAMQSTDRQQLIRALRFLDALHYDERVEHADLWVPDLRGLLEHDDFPVRAMAARHLSVIGDRSAVPVLLDLLRSGRQGEKSAADMLRQISGEKFPFDPDAPPEEKEAQIRAWEEWWEKESADRP